LAEWRARLQGTEIPAEPVQTLLEVLDDPQVIANGYIGEVTHPNGETVTLVRPPVQFDEAVPPLRTAPAVGADTTDVLGGAGYSSDEIDELRARRVIG
jgi:crotonobetainyl-CoA:carnitine CoA-transferase CaiB-like acyl-CoA transferase